MTGPQPFQYSADPHQRRHGPSGYSNYQDYKPWLRDEFVFRCVYCLEREVWYPSGANAFSVDHVVPKSEAPTLICEYDNLLYVCLRCNSFRGVAKLLNPTNTAFGDHLHVTPDGIAHGLTVMGLDIIDQLHLNGVSAVDTRNRVLRILRLKEQFPDNTEVDELFRETFRYPNDLPILAIRKPPSGNSRQDALELCFHARQLRGELSAIY
jgi:hypothetical protein